jgi:hypothetical protein
MRSVERKSGERVRAGLGRPVREGAGIMTLRAFDT